MLIDDDPWVRSVVGDLLADEGYRVVRAGTGLAGLETARRERPTAILLDLGLPGLSGVDVIRRLRADPELGPSPSWW